MRTVSRDNNKKYDKLKKKKNTLLSKVTQHQPLFLRHAPMDGYSREVLLHQ